YDISVSHEFCEPVTSLKVDLDGTVQFFIQQGGTGQRRGRYTMDPLQYPRFLQAFVREGISGFNIYFRYIILAKIKGGVVIHKTFNFRNMGKAVPGVSAYFGNQGNPGEQPL